MASLRGTSFRNGNEPVQTAILSRGTSNLGARSRAAGLTAGVLSGHLSHKVNRRSGFGVGSSVRFRTATSNGESPSIVQLALRKHREIRHTECESEVYHERQTQFSIEQRQADSTTKKGGN
jgi:hypothetical protein